MNSSASAVSLVASREITARLRSRAYVLSTLITVLVIVAGVVVTSLVNGRSSTTTVVVTAQQRALGQALAARTGDDPVRVRVAGSAAAATFLVRRGGADAFVDVAPHGLAVVVETDLPGALRSRLAALATQRVLTQQVQALGGDPAAVTGALARAGLGVRALAPRPAYDATRLAIGFVAAVLIFIALQTAGQSVAMGVVEEKSSRVVEVLLATVRPWQLLAGKVLGLGLLGLAQVLLIAGAGAVAALATGAIDLPASTAATMVGWLVVWFVLGYTAFSVVFAALGALVSRTEEIGGATAPLLFVVIGGYVVGVSVLPGDPSNHLVAIMSLIPAFSPTLMPVRLAIGGVPVWQTVLSLTLLIATIPVLVWASARIYRNAVVRSGAKVKLLDALRGR